MAQVSIKMLTLGNLSTNCYIVADTESRQAVVIDPVDDAETILRIARAEDWTIKKIFATHGHFDHILASAELRELTNAPFLIHENELDNLRATPRAGLRFIGAPFPEPAPVDEYLTTELQKIEIGAISLQTLFTPGHSPGHIAFYMESANILFSGDTLFMGSVGRTDLPGGDTNTLFESIVQRLLPLGDDVQVLSGHTPPTTIGNERKRNPFLAPYRTKT